MLLLRTGVQIGVIGRAGFLGRSGRSGTAEWPGILEDFHPFGRRFRLPQLLGVEEFFPAPPVVILIQGASQAMVLSDILTAATEGTGKLRGVFLRRGTNDRDSPERCGQPPFYQAANSLSRQSYSAVGGGGLPRALLAAG